MGLKVCTEISHPNFTFTNCTNVEFPLYIWNRTMKSLCERSYCPYHRQFSRNKGKRNKFFGACAVHIYFVINFIFMN